MTTRSSIAPLRSLLFVLSTLPTLAACPAAGDEGDDEIGESDSTDESDESTDTGESDAGESDESTDESSPETDSTTDESSDTGELDPDTALCQQYCDASYPCTNDGPQDGTCVATCLEDLHAQQAGMCLDNEAVLLACLATLTCDEYEAYLWHEEGESFPCDGEKDASCECTEASAETSGGATASDCSLDYACIGETDYALECSGAGCVCFVDGVETGGCAEPMPVCAEVLGDGFTFETVNACCGWSLG